VFEQQQRQVAVSRFRRGFDFGEDVLGEARLQQRGHRVEERRSLFEASVFEEAFVKAVDVGSVLDREYAELLAHLGRLPTKRKHRNCVDVTEFALAVLGFGEPLRLVGSHRQSEHAHRDEQNESVHEMALGCGHHV